MVMVVLEGVGLLVLVLVLVPAVGFGSRGPLLAVTEARDQDVRRAQEAVVVAVAVDATAASRF
jgi:hypothetical protein